MSTQESGPDELIFFEAPITGAPESKPLHVWRVLVVDDDDDVHEATRFALKNVTVLGRPLQLVHARSAADGLLRARTEIDFAVALIDVVMETPEAGLQLVRDLRASGLNEMRIVLRTGQPGYAPEVSVVTAYEIDDYRTKSELTRTRLLTVLTATIRAYEQICTISRSRAGLEMIVASAAKLFQRTNLELFSRGVLTQIASLLGVVPNGLVCVKSTDESGRPQFRIVSAAGGFSPYLGGSSDNLEDETVLALLEEVRGRSEPVVKGQYLGLFCARDSGSELVAILETAGEVAGSDLDLLRLFSTNIAIGFENVALLEKLDRLAYLDPILNIPNLNAFEAALLARAEGLVDLGRMALVNIESFQSVVAAYGQQTADALLAAVYRELSACGAEAPRFIARVGDGQFALLGTRAALEEHHITGAFSKPYRIGDIEIAAAATTVLIDLGEVGADIGSAMRVARAALLQAAQTRRGNCVVYDASMRSEVKRRISTQIALRQALKQGEGLAVHLQPKYQLVSQEVVGSEALLRWTHGNHPISPADFIPIAESAGLIQDLTQIVIDRVGQWTRHYSGGGGLPPVAINLSMADLNTPGFAQWLLRQVAAAGLSEATVEFEVTEGIAMQDAPWAIEQVRALKEAGFRIALDDFGTGYCSLGQFERLPIDTVKIDRRFIATLDVGSARQSLAAVILGMSQVLGVRCVAEGVETVAQQEALVLLGCTIGQGYLFGRAVPMEDFQARYLRPLS